MKKMSMPDETESRDKGAEKTMKLSEQVTTQHALAVARADENRVEALCIYTDCLRRDHAPENQDMRQLQWALGILGLGADQYVADAAAYARAQRRRA